METEDLFGMEYDLTEAKGFIERHDPTKAWLIGKLKQKCFLLIADGPCGDNGYTHRYYRVFPTFIIASLVEHRCHPNYVIGGHNLGSCALRSLLLSKLCYYKDTVSTVVSRFQLLQQKCDRTLQSVLLRRDLQKEIKETLWREQLKKDEDEFYLNKQLFDSELRSFKRDKAEFVLEREAFEKEKHNLEMELAKYKGIVENCMKEISSYGF